MWFDAVLNRLGITRDSNTALQLGLFGHVWAFATSTKQTSVKRTDNTTSGNALDLRLTLIIVGKYCSNCSILPPHFAFTVGQLSTFFTTWLRSSLEQFRPLALYGNLNSGAFKYLR